MKNKELLDILSKFSPDAEIIIKREIGFGRIKMLTPGIFKLTDYGNDFWPYEDIIIEPAEVKAVSVSVDDYEEMSSISIERKTIN